MDREQTMSAMLPKIVIGDIVVFGFEKGHLNRQSRVDSGISGCSSAGWLGT